MKFHRTYEIVGCICSRNRPYNLKWWTNVGGRTVSSGLVTSGTGSEETLPLFKEGIYLCFEETNCDSFVFRTWVYKDRYNPRVRGGKMGVSDRRRNVTMFSVSVSTQFRRFASEAGVVGW